MTGSSVGRDRNRGRITRAAAALALAAGCVLAGGPAAAQPAVLYAAVTPAGTQDCSSAADACSLTTALGEVAAGGTVELVTPGGTARYVGNWTVSTSGTSASQPVTIEPEPGLSSPPILDGNGPDAPSGQTCSTSSCNGPVLTVPGGEYVSLAGITIADGDNTTTSTSTGGGLLVSGSVTVTGATFTDNAAGHGGAIDSGDGATGGTGSVRVTGSTFTGNTAQFDGGAIDSGDTGNGGQVVVTASTFAGNTAQLDGGAIDNADGGFGQVTVSASTFTGNAATEYNGGAIDSSDDGGHGSLLVTASTFTDNTAQFHGPVIDGADGGGGGQVVVAADVFAGSCDQAGGTWTDAGYNAVIDGSCFGSGGTGTDVDAGSAGALDLGSLASNGGPTQTIMPQPGSPVIGIVPDPTHVSTDVGTVTLCPATDQRGYASAPGPCDAGAVQTTGTVGLALSDSSPTAGYRQAGDVIDYDYLVTNTGAGALAGITINDPAVPGASCPDASLGPGASETCTGSYTVTSADVAAGKVTDTAAAAGTTSVGGTVTSNASTVTVRVAWPASVSGTYRPAAGAAEGYYLGVTGATWSLLVTHPGTGKVAFTGTITINAGTLTALTPVSFTKGDSATVKGKTLTFTIASYGKVNGFRFATTTAATSITFTLEVAGQPATASQIYLGSGPTQSSSPSPLTFTR